MTSDELASSVVRHEQELAQLRNILGEHLDLLDAIVTKFKAPEPPAPPAKPAWNPDALSAEFDDAHARFQSAAADARSRFLSELERFLVFGALPLAANLGLSLVPGGSTAAIVLGIVSHEALPILERLTATPK